MNDNPAAGPLETDESVRLMNTRKTMGSTVIGWVISMMAASMTLFLFYSGYNDYTEIETNTWTA